MAFLIPTGVERRQLGRFYLASFIGELSHLAMPFQVLLILRYGTPAQLGLLLVVEQAAEMLVDLPSSAWADRFGRKPVVVASHFVEALGWALIPVATLFHPGYRLVVFAAAFALLGLSSALESGTFDAWVVDNLNAEGQERLIINFFGRERSFSSAGGITADLLAIALVSLIDMRLFWIATALGEIAVAVTLSRIPERVPDEDEDTDEAEDEEESETIPSSITMLKAGLRSLYRRPALLALTLTLIWITATSGALDEGYHAALVQGNLHKQFFPVLELGTDIMGIFAPLLAISLTRRLGSWLILALTVAVPGLLAGILWTSPPLIVISAIYLVDYACSDIFQTAADDYQQRLIPSAGRATTTSAISLSYYSSQLVAGGLLGLLLLTHPASKSVALLGLASIPGIIFLIRRHEDSKGTAAPSAEE